MTWQPTRVGVSGPAPGGASGCQNVGVGLSVVNLRVCAAGERGGGVGSDAASLPAPGRGSPEEPQTPVLNGAAPGRVSVSEWVTLFESVSVLECIFVFERLCI